MTAIRAKMARLWWAVTLVAASAIVFVLDDTPATAVSGTVELSDRTAPNLIGDSNVESNAGDGPDAFVISSQYCNTNDHPVYDVTVHVGTWGGTAAMSTPGVFEDTVVPAGGPYVGSFDLDIVPGLGNPETRYLGELDAGECTIVNTIVSYDVVDANGKAVFGGNPIADDLAYHFDYWATWSDPGADGTIGTSDDQRGLEANATDSVTVRSQITASTNKIPATAATASPTGLIPVGETVTITFTDVEFGNVNMGFDADNDGNDDYDIWFQPIGEASLWNPDVLQLIGIESTVRGTTCQGKGGNVVLMASDTTYFDRLDVHRCNDWSGTYAYTFLALTEGTATIAPYQEAASGKNNAKYNAGYCGDDPTSAPSICRIVSTTDGTLTTTKSVSPTTANPGDTLTWTIGYTNPSSNPVGDPNSGFGVSIDDPIPASTTYVAGSAACGDLACIVRYSVDGGATYAAVEPANPASVTHLRWTIDEKIGGGASGTVTFKTTVDAGATGLIDNTANTTIGGHPTALTTSDAAACTGACGELAIDLDTLTPAVTAGGQATYAVTVENLATATGDATSVDLAVSLPTGFTFASTSSIVVANADGTDPVRTTTIDPGAGDAAPSWSGWTLNPGDSITITFVVDVADATPPGTYDSDASATSLVSTATDAGTAADDGGFTTSRDPEPDDDVTIISTSTTTTPATTTTVPATTAPPTTTSTTTTSTTTTSTTTTSTTPPTTTTSTTTTSTTTTPTTTTSTTTTPAPTTAPTTDPPTVTTTAPSVTTPATTSPPASTTPSVTTPTTVVTTTVAPSVTAPTTTEPPTIPAPTTTTPTTSTAPSPTTPAPTTPATTAPPTATTPTATTPAGTTPAGTTPTKRPTVTAPTTTVTTLATTATTAPPAATPGPDDEPNTPPTVQTSTITVGVDQPIPSLVLADREDDTITVTLVDGDLPPGVTLERDGTFVGTSTKDGAWTSTVQLCDSRNSCDQYEITLLVPAENLPETGSDGVGRVLALSTLILLSGFAAIAASRRRADT